MSIEAKIAAGLAELEAMDRADLVVRWQALMPCPPPKSSSKCFLLRSLSYELQSRHAPGLRKADQKVLHAALPSLTSSPLKPRGDGNDADLETNNASPKPRMTVVPGSRLVREWNGRTYTVSVIEDGFIYQNKTWPSLSAIARDITGAHWSGPRFFGLNRASR